MATLVIGYDLNNAGKNYDDLIEGIKNLSSNWWHHLDSTWIVITRLSPSEVRDQLKVHLDGDDELLVATIGTPAAWRGFNTRGSDWLKNNL